MNTLETYYAVVEIEAANREQAETVLGARIGHDEDLREDGVEDYTIDSTRPLIPARTLPHGELYVLDPDLRLTADWQDSPDQ